jgi:hypothetical protein
MQNLVGVTAVVPNCSQALVSIAKTTKKIMPGWLLARSSTNTKMRNLKLMHTDVIRDLVRMRCIHMDLLALPKSQRK